jgi:hypothetical protein
LFIFLVGAAPLIGGESVALAQFSFRLQVAPPALRVEAIPPAPSPRHVWIAGYWGYNNGQHVWIPGYHDIPPAPGYHWIGSRWVNEGGFWVFKRGHWAPPGITVFAEPPQAPVAEAIVVQAQPPPPQVEVIPPLPSPNHFWIPGHWRWDPMVQRHVWMGGHFELRQPGQFWVPAHWQRDWAGGWRFEAGHWRRG